MAFVCLRICANLKSLKFKGWLFYFVIVLVGTDIKLAQSPLTAVVVCCVMGFVIRQHQQHVRHFVGVIILL